MSSVRSWWPVPAVAVTATLVLLATGHHTLDLAVYRFGGEAVLRDGAHLYDVREPGSGLPFTYPPIAAVLMVPWALLPEVGAVAVWTLVSVGALAVAVAICLRAQGYAVRSGAVAAVTAAAIALEPVWATIAFGQINLVLLALVLADLLVVRGRGQGVLIGVAAALKLTPLVFIAFLLLTGRWRAAGTAGAAFVACHLAGWLLLPHASAAYFGGTAFDPDRVGGVPFASNQSVLGVLARLGGGEPGTWAWLLVAGALSGLTLLVAARWWRREPLLSAGVAGLAMLLASPISWSNHWVWCLPLAVGLVRRSAPVALAWVAVFVSACIFWPPHSDDRELAWTLGDQVLGNAYLWAALLLVVAVVARPVAPQSAAGRMRPATSPSDSRPPSTPGALVRSSTRSPSWRNVRSRPPATKGSLPPQLSSRNEPRWSRSGPEMVPDP